ncbi:ferrochelatase [Parapedobacter sp. ISTM3]|uniref:Ferrochelatase n=1 Tax=Parapedobacter luteus TaxID=623280 RepID=A0A1T5F499_9SPHI|nr:MULTISPECIES: ferrochelatase [Parapedobacter]MBK1442163.1 ferrochelatase [Parapedobacter sp. ISTM3]SKB91025.1 ferrochelatase [Parapedobacter luteus]
MSKPKKGILLVNLGTPDSPSVPDVKRYLTEFLMDGRVIDIPAWRRSWLVKGIIVPFRAPNSAKLYKEIWDDDTGSPLLYYSMRQQQLLQERLGDEYYVELAMRYQNPSIASALERLKQMKVDSIRIIPLFPQYASATTGSVIEKITDEIRNWATFPAISIVNQFFDHEGMIDVFAENAQRYRPETYDHYLFSYHGLPVRQLLHVDGTGTHRCDEAKCREQITEDNKFCYVAQCYATTRLIAKRLNLNAEAYTVCFQSRLGKTPWIQPYTSDVLKDVAARGKKRLLVFCPAFVSDCLETVYEVGTEYATEFKELGGEMVQLVESLNDHPKWIAVLEKLVYSDLPEWLQKEKMTV